jgi:uncharacterized protein (DUF1330 family)
MPKSAFFLIFLAIPDPTAASLAEYKKCVKGSLAPFNGQVVCHASGASGESAAAYAERTTMSEDYDMCVLIRFDSVDSAKAWYSSEEYQRILPMRTGCSNGPGAIVDGTGLSTGGDTAGKGRGAKYLFLAFIMPLADRSKAKHCCTTFIHTCTLTNHSPSILLA